MRRKWKSLSVLGMAALIGCLVPAGTMMAAEKGVENAWENGAGSVSDNTVQGDNGDTPDDRLNTDNEVKDDSGVSADDDVKTDDEADEEASADVKVDADGEVNADDAVNADVDADGQLGIMPLAERSLTTNSGAAAVGTDAPVIDIKWQGQNRTNSLGGKIEYEYVNNHNQSMNFSATQGGQAVSLFFYQDKVTDTTAEAKGQEQMATLSWQTADNSSVTFINDGNYVVYVKAEGADGQVAYARSGGIVVDTEAPKITGVQEGNFYPEGTTFQVKDANLESVTVNEIPVTPSADGKYQVTANGTSCVIKAKDKAGNNVTCSISVSGRDPAQDGNKISKSGIYALKEGVSYRLAEGRWSIVDDSSVYVGNNDFYINKAGDYTFIKR